MSKLKRILSAVLIASLFPTTILTSCGKEKVSSPETTPPESTVLNQPKARFIPQSKGIPTDEDFIKSVNDFSQSLFRLSLEKGKNLVLSPLSVTYALSMTANGASGETLAEFNSLNGGIDVNKMNEYLCSLTHRMAETEESTVEIGNSVWANKQNFSINETFRETVLAYYGAEAAALDFTKQESVDTINQWVSEHTDGMIDKAVDDIDPMTAMLLINTILFDGKWEVPYEEYDIVSRSFYGYTTTTEDAKFLNSTEHSYFEVEDGVGFSKAYKDGYKFVAILPNEGVDVYDFARGLDVSDTVYTANNSYEKVICQIPKFEYEFEVNLNEILQSMGLNRAFSATDAELQGLGTSDFGLLFISKIFQKAKIKLDESGTKAAAMTGVILECTAAEPIIEPKRITLDRPFVYMIVDTETGIPLFMGVLADLEE